MKTLNYFLIMALIIFASCAKYETSDETVDLKKAKVPIPMKAEFCMTPNMDAGFFLIEGLDPTLQTSYLPREGWISGFATHMGEVIMQESTVTFTSAVFVPGTGVVSTSEGQITAANGDYYLFTETTITYPNGTFKGNVWMYGGTGKFSGMTGPVVMTGQKTDQGACWTGVGTMVYE